MLPAREHLTSLLQNTQHGVWAWLYFLPTYARVSTHTEADHFYCAIKVKDGIKEETNGSWQQNRELSKSQMDFLSSSLSADVDGQLKVLVLSFGYIDLDFIVDKKISAINLKSLSWASKSFCSLGDPFWLEPAVGTCGGADVF